MPPRRESNAARNFGAVWLQTNVDGRNGWCARNVESIIKVPRDTRIENFVPHFDRVRSPRGKKVRLVINADGDADRNGVVKNRFWLVPRGIRPSVSDNNRRLVLRWTGNTAQKLAFALGVEFSWNDQRGFDGRPQVAVRTTLRRC
jgi:hypothetical protein